MRHAARHAVRLVCGANGVNFLKFSNHISFFISFPFRTMDRVPEHGEFSSSFKKLQTLFREILPGTSSRGNESACQRQPGALKWSRSLVLENTRRSSSATPHQLLWSLWRLRLRPRKKSKPRRESSTPKRHHQAFKKPAQAEVKEIQVPLEDHQKETWPQIQPV